MLFRSYKYALTSKRTMHTVRDNYPLPFIEHVLERVGGHEAYSFLDGFSGYNQLSIDPKDKHKTAFATTWGVFAYQKMPFGLTNAPATFQRLMSIAFKEYLRIWLEIFLDDLCMYSQWLEHLRYLQMVFDHYQLYRILLNPLKYQFWVKHGVILGHVVSRNGISIDYGKIKLILELLLPPNFKGVQRFIGHIGYYRKFIYLYVEIVRPLYKLLINFKWIEECQKAYRP